MGPQKVSILPERRTTSCRGREMWWDGHQRQRRGPRATEGEQALRKGGTPHYTGGAVGSQSSGRAITDDESASTRTCPLRSGGDRSARENYPSGLEGGRTRPECPSDGLLSAPEPVAVSRGMSKASRASRGGSPRPTIHTTYLEGGGGENIPTTGSIAFWVAQTRHVHPRGKNGRWGDRRVAGAAIQLSEGTTQMIRFFRGSFDAWPAPPEPLRFLLPSRPLLASGFLSSSARSDDFRLASSKPVCGGDRADAMATP